MKTRLIIVLLLCLFVLDVHAQESERAARQVVKSQVELSRDQPNKEYFINGETIFEYEEGRQYQIYAAPLRDTDIILEKGEYYRSIPVIADSARWVLAKAILKSGPEQQHVLIIKPKRSGLATSMTIYTNKRMYKLELHSDKVAYMPTVKWTYADTGIIDYSLPDKNHDKALADGITDYSLPDKHEVSSLAKPHVDKTLSTSLNIARKYHNYTFQAQGAVPTWMPDDVFDDGKKTYIEFPKTLSNGVAPALFLVSPSGRTQIVNYRVDHNFYIVDRLFTHAQLRVGDGDDSQIVAIISKNNKSDWLHNLPW